MDRKKHWESIYQNKKADEVSWFQVHSSTSLAVIRQHIQNKDAKIIDVGAGASVLVDDLIAAGFKNIDLLDISQSSLSVTKERLKYKHLEDTVNYLVGDILNIDLPDKHYDVWHDRAVFHFLTKAEQQQRYIQQCFKALKPNGKVIISTFGPEGPLQCSGLPIVRYNHNALHQTFGPAFQLIEHGEEDHITPSGSTQKFIYCFCKLENNSNT